MRRSGMAMLLVLASHPTGCACERNYILSGTDSGSTVDSPSDPWSDPDLDAGDPSPEPCGDHFCHAGDRCCDGSCVDVLTDMDNCGGCGRSCDRALADSCLGGDCTCAGARACTSPQKCCPDLGCRNIMTDTNNCGDCGIVCASGMNCTAGECNCGGAPCPEGYGCCSSLCKDLRYDATNCGTCGHACGVNGPACVDGSCVCGDGPPCTRCSFTECSSLVPPGPYPSCELCCPSIGGCMPQSDENCGACGTACTTGTRCEPVIGPWTCRFECVSTSTDASTDGDD